MVITTGCLNFKPKLCAPQGILASAPYLALKMAHAVRRGWIELPVPMREWFAKALEGSRIELLPLTPTIALRAVELSDHHRDPFDRIIIATALELVGQLVSVDGQFPAYPELAGRLLA